MNKSFKFLITMLAIMALSVFLTPVFYSFLSPYFRFEKIFDRLVMIFTVLAAFLFVLVPQIKKGRVKDPEAWRRYGFDFRIDWKKLFIYGFLTGAIFVFAIAFGEAAFGPRYLRSPLELQDIIERFVKGMLSGLTIGIVEEFFFRGFVYTHMRKKMNLPMAVILTSIFYAMVHFLNNGQIFIPEHPGIKDCIRLMIGYLEPFTRPQAIMGDFIGLFLFGIVLNLAFNQTGSLFLPIGIHAGVVFAIKWQASFVRSGFDNDRYPYLATNLFYDGLIEWVMMILLGFVVWFYARRLKISPR